MKSSTKFTSVWLLFALTTALSLFFNYLNAQEIEASKPMFIKIFQQKEQFLLVDGVVKLDRKTELENATVYLTSHNEVLKKVATTKKGRYKFLLKKNKEYKIIICKEGFEPKTILFNTNMPSQSPKFNKYLMAVYLEPNNVPLDNHINAFVNPENAQPMARVSYNPFAYRYQAVGTQFSLR